MLTYTYLFIHQSSAMCTNPGYMQESSLSRDAETAVFPTTSISFSERTLHCSQASQETLSLHQVLGLLQGHLTKRVARRHSRQIKGASAHRQHRQPFGGASFMPLVSMISFFQLVPKLCVHRWGQKLMLSSETDSLGFVLCLFTTTVHYNIRNTADAAPIRLSIPRSAVSPCYCSATTWRRN